MRRISNFPLLAMAWNHGISLTHLFALRRRFAVSYCLLIAVSLPTYSQSPQDPDPSHLILILQNQLLDLEPNDARNNPQQSISQFQQNQSARVADIGWVYTVPAHEVTVQNGGFILKLRPADHALAGSGTQPGFNMQSSRTEANSITTFTLSAITPQPPLQINGVPFGMLINGSLTVPRCAFSFATNPTCYPAVTIFNASLPDANTPNIAFTVTQPAISPRRLVPGATMTVDRSVGDTTVTLEPIETRVMSKIVLSVAINSGPSSAVGPGISLGDRARTYDQLVDLHQRLDKAKALSADPLQAIEAETLASAIHIISAQAVLAKYPDIVREFLLSRAKDIASADQRILDVRNLVIASSSLTSAQVDLLITRINNLLADSNVGHREALVLIRDELIRAKDATTATSGAVQVLRNNFQTDLDRIIKEYQMFILEYAQYVTNDQLKTLLDVNERNAIATRISPVDVQIKAETLSGRGAILQSSFGLPGASK